MAELTKIIRSHPEAVNAADHAGWTPLNEAARGGYLRAVKLLVANGADVGTRNAEGDTPLDVAVKAKETRVVVFLSSRTARSPSSWALAGYAVIRGRARRI